MGDRFKHAGGHEDEQDAAAEEDDLDQGGAKGAVGLGGALATGLAVGVGVGGREGDPCGLREGRRGGATTRDP